LEFLERKIDTNILELQYQIPSTRTRINKKKRDENMTSDQLQSTFDNWKGVGNDGKGFNKKSTTKTEKNEKSNNKGKKPSVFFNKQNMKNM
jgi:hypothetical protein